MFLKIRLINVTRNAGFQMKLREIKLEKLHSPSPLATLDGDSNLWWLQCDVDSGNFERTAGMPTTMLSWFT